ncbi:hypothetical protein JOD43_004102 [Pullulanibacillus pueri]|uniref:Uncharacterized protein n=1 Tax=Pullulanibacillus pueri TaxID=1437324 RepID=A0A8J3EP45_9BACL|nr:hypothetical protein [Pullulanibacillus pueri]MBM7683906.1 hypothetical protein [Pullulanibacillus pueri]GGH87815.1 hypothetical protein GCM10007096_38700 [Pullulanibacillus pueri]
MKILKISVFCLIALFIAYYTFKWTQGVIEKQNANYLPENPYIEKEKDHHTTQDYSSSESQPMQGHNVNGSRAVELPIDGKQNNHIIYKGQLYITNNKGKTWLAVPDDDTLGYPRISDDQKSLSESNIYVSSERVAIVYGGQGPENISVLFTDGQYLGEIWRVWSLSKSATQNLQKGYEKLYIDFLNSDKTGYIVAIRKEGEQQVVTAYRSVNSGITWDAVHTNDPLYNEIMKHFGL